MEEFRASFGIHLNLIKRILCPQRYFTDHFCTAFRRGFFTSLQNTKCSERLLKVHYFLFATTCLLSCLACTLHSLYRLVVRPVLDLQPPLSTACIAFLPYSLVQHHPLAATLFSVQPIMSAVLIHLLTNWHLQRCRCWPGSIASTNRFPAFPASSA